MTTVQEQQAERQRLLRKELIREFGSTESYVGALSFVDIVSPADERLADFYSLYARIFTLEEEREPLEGFRQVLAFNKRDEVQEEFGPLCEQVTVAIDPRSDRIVGAANYIIYGYDRDFRRKFGCGASSQLNFLCVDEGHRGVGIADRLLRRLYEKLKVEVAKSDDSEVYGFVTCEQNNPERMTEEQLAEDLAAALIDPYDRMMWWYRRGYRRLGFDYCQPPLSPQHEPCSYIDYYVRFVGDGREVPSTLPSPVLVEHLRRFFFVSVGKFERDMSVEPNWLRQREQLARCGEVAIG